MGVPAALELLQFFIQPAGMDFRAIWAGGRAAWSDVSRLYDFDFVTSLQGWPLGPDRLRPFPYPPSTLFIAAPLALLPWPVAYGVWVAIALPLFGLAARRAGAPAWVFLAPWVIFSIFCGQLTLFLGALVTLGLSERARRPIVAGLLFGLAAAIKPQLLALLPVALLAEGRWRVLLSTGGAGMALCAASAVVWGVDPWLRWLESLYGFAEIVAGQQLLNLNSVTPASALRHWGLDTRWALVAAPFAVVWVWLTFRREPPFETALVALLGAAMLVAPYVMIYDLALFAPATAIYLARVEDRRWPAYLVAAAVQHAPPPGLFRLLGALAPALLQWPRREREDPARP